jgi:hypothetical protein
MFEKFLCFLGLHRWLIYDAKETLRVCGRRDCSASQEKVTVFFCDGFGEKWQNL